MGFRTSVAHLVSLESSMRDVTSAAAATSEDRPLASENSRKHVSRENVSNSDLLAKGGKMAAARNSSTANTSPIKPLLHSSAAAAAQNGSQQEFHPSARDAQAARQMAISFVQAAHISLGGLAAQFAGNDLAQERGKDWVATVCWIAGLVCAVMLVCCVVGEFVFREEDRRRQERVQQASERAERVQQQRNDGTATLSFQAIKDRGKETRGGTADDKYVFGDFSRGLKAALSNKDAR